MAIYEVVKKIFYDSAIVHPIHFHLKNNSTFAGSVHLSHLRHQLKKIELNDDIVVNSHAITVNFPVFDNYYKESETTDHGFTLEELFNAIYNIGLHAVEWDLHEHPEHYTKDTQDLTPKNILKKFSIIDGDIQVTGNCVYVNLHPYQK